MIDRLIKKPVLTEDIPDTLPPEVVAPSVDQTVTIPEASLRTEAVEEIKEEVLELDRLLNSLQIPGVAVDPEVFGVSTISLETLSSAMKDASPVYPAMVSAWTNHHYNVTGTVEAIVSSSLQEVREDLLRAVEFLQLIPQQEGDTVENIVKVELNKKRSVTAYRTKVEAAMKRAREELEQCMIDKLLRWITSGHLTSQLMEYEKLQKISETARTLRKILRLSILTRSAKVENIVKLLSTRLNDIISTKLLQELINVLSSLESRIVAPITDMLESLDEMNDTDYCGAFDEFINLVYDELGRVRSRYIAALYDYEMAYSSKMLSREALLVEGIHRVTVDKQIFLLDKLLELVEYVGSVGELQKRALDQLLYSTVGKKSQTGTEKGGNPTNG